LVYFADSTDRAHVYFSSVFPTADVYEGVLLKFRKDMFEENFQEFEKFENL